MYRKKFCPLYPLSDGAPPDYVINMKRLGLSWIMGTIAGAIFTICFLLIIKIITEKNLLSFFLSKLIILYLFIGLIFVMCANLLVLGWSGICYRVFYIPGTPKCRNPEEII
jgi:hypothetical protein